VAFCLAAVGFVSGRLTLTVDVNMYLTQPTAWATLLIANGMFSVVTLQAIGEYNRSLIKLVQEVKQQRDQIEQLATYDQLTGLPLMRLAEDRIKMAIHSARRSANKIALLFIDLDGFKAVNDTFGHEAGDQVLREVAKRLTGAIRAEDTAARIGGDELLVVLVGLRDSNVAAVVAEKIIRAISAPIAYKTHSIAVGASIGISLFPDHASDAQTLRQLADTAMYTAKKSGKNGFAVAP
jgi:diguanylate cyclase (GGDEF)-like protein